MVKTPSAVPSGTLMHEMQAITKQKVQFLRALIERPAMMRQTAKAHASRTTTDPKMINNHPNSAGGGGLEAEPGGKCPETIQAPKAMCTIGKQPISAVIPPNT